MLIHHYQNKITNEAVQHNYNTRTVAKENVRTLRMQKSIGQKSFEYQGPKLFNMLPVEYKQCKHFIKYKKMIRNWLIDQGRDLFNKIQN